MAVVAALPAGAAEVAVDAGKVTGRIRALHGGNDGPLQPGGLTDLTALHRELGIPFTRLHDCGWPNPDVVDMHAVFPNPKADPSLPESYDFALTDAFIEAVRATGAQVIYRLGQSIEHGRIKRHVHPPADPDRWAAACIGIIRHYNEGWANGFRHDIRYWEIWNEPENRPVMWTGTDEQFLHLYEVTAKAIKARWPELKVGGPAFGHTGRIVDGRFEPSAFVVRFLEHCRDRSVPLDFFSWHLYTNDPRECVVRARGIRALLDRHGFTRTESHFNEWNYLPDNDWGPATLKGQGLPRERFYERVGNAEGAAFAAAVLMNLQDAPVDVACYFSANTQGFGLFSTHGAPRKVFYAFKAFRMLLETPVRLEVDGAPGDRLTLCAGRDEAGTMVGILVAHAGPAEERLDVALRNLPWDGPTRWRTFHLNAERTLEPDSEGVLSESTLAIPLKGPGVYLLQLRPAR